MLFQSGSIQCGAGVGAVEGADDPQDELQGESEFEPTTPAKKGSGSQRRFRIRNTSTTWSLSSLGYTVYVVDGLSLVLIVTFCCPGGRGSAKKSDPKKTEGVQQDDQVED